jgi:Domain of unknown function (DUF4276)
MNQAVVMVEENSIEEVTKIIAKRLGIENQVIVIPHEGKNDLERSFPRKIVHWRNPQRTRFVICRDNDGSNCVILKQRLRDLLPQTTHHEFKLRLVMNELEAWYLADLQALRSAGLISQGFLEQNQDKKIFRSPENLNNAKQEFKKIVKTNGQITLARKIAPHLELENERCSSFKHFISAIKWAVE